MRSLARAGIPVIGIATEPREAGLASRYGTRIVAPHPNPNHQPEAWLDLLTKLGRRQDEGGVIFPASDELVLFLSQHRNQLSPYFLLAIPPPGAAEVGLDKRRQYELAASLGIPHPQTCYPNNETETREVAEQLSYPVFVKPQHSHLWRWQADSNIKGIKVASPGVLASVCAPILSKGLKIAVQSIVPGPPENLISVAVYLCGDQEVLAQYSARKIRQCPCEFGVATIAETVWEPEAIALALRFLTGAGYHGVAHVEFKRDPRDGLLKLIELNPRMWGHIQLAIDAGVNFPLIQYLDLTGAAPARQPEFRLGLRWLDVFSDINTFLWYYRRGEISILGWMSSCLPARSFSYWAWNDPGPFFKNALHGTCQLGRRFVQRYLRKTRPSSGR